jgi:hypothetical protein
VLQDDSDSSSELEDLADVSRYGSGWKLKRNGQRGGTKQSRSKRTNWYHPFLWTAIDAAARKAHWSPTETTKALKRLNPTLYRTIGKGTISKWIDSETKREWSAATKKNVVRRHALAGSGQLGILAKHPEIVKEINTQLQGLRKSGLAVNVLIARSIMLAIIKHRAPDLLVRFKCSEVSVVITSQVSIELTFV